MELRTLAAADAEVYWACRLRALRDHPDTFASSYDEERERPLAHTIERLETTLSGPENYIVGAWEGRSLLGTAGFSREQRIKVRHKGTIWGVYVVPEARGRQIGTALIQTIIDRARLLDGLEQIQLMVTTTNAPAQRIYTQLGFTTYGVERRALKLGDRYVDEAYMVYQMNQG